MDTEKLFLQKENYKNKLKPQDLWIQAVRTQLYCYNQVLFTEYKSLQKDTFLHLINGKSPY